MSSLLNMYVQLLSLSYHVSCALRSVFIETLIGGFSDEDVSEQIMSALVALRVMIFRMENV